VCLVAMHVALSGRWFLTVIRRMTRRRAAA
jgi:hypothetical protein